MPERTSHYQCKYCFSENAGRAEEQDNRRDGMDFWSRRGQEILRISEDFSRRGQVYFDPKNYEDLQKNMKEFKKLYLYYIVGWSLCYSCQSFTLLFAHSITVQARAGDCQDGGNLFGRQSSGV